MRFFADKILSFKKTGVLLPCLDRIIFAQKKGAEVIYKEERIPEGTINPHPFGPNITSSAYLEAIETLRRKDGLEGRVIMLLPEGSTFITVAELARVPEDPEERRQMVLFYMKKRFQGKGEITVAEQPLSPTRVLVAVTTREAISSFVDPVKANGIKVVSIKPSSISALNYLLHRESKGDFIFILFLRKRTVFLGVKGGNLEIYRALREPFTEDEFYEELLIIEKYLGNGLKLYGCGKGELSHESIDMLGEDCFELMIRGELL